MTLGARGQKKKAEKVRAINYGSVKKPNAPTCLITHSSQEVRSSWGPHRPPHRLPPRLPSHRRLARRSHFTPTSTPSCPWGHLVAD